MEVELRVEKLNEMIEGEKLSPHARLVAEEVPLLYIISMAKSAKVTC